MTAPPPITRKDKPTFDNEWGEKLAGLLEQPAANTRAFALFAHCFTCPKDILAAAHISRALAAEGFGVLRFDFTGLGDSEGNFPDTTFSTHVRDILQGAAYLRENFAAPALLIGHSLGALAVLSAAKAIPEAKAVVTIAAPANPGAIGRLLEEGAPGTDGPDDKNHEIMALMKERLESNPGFLADLSASIREDDIRNLGKALLVLHSPRDEAVGLNHARKLFEAARHPKSFISLDGADHLLSHREDARYAARMMATWAQRYIRPMEAAPPLLEEPEIGEVLVTELDGRFSQDIRTHRHQLLADEPLGVGGADTGPSPYELLLAGLGSCTAMTIRMYANHKKLPLKKVSVRLEHEKIDARDCPDCKTREGKVDRITRQIYVEGDLTPEQHKRIATIANRCPVHRTIHAEIDDQVSVTDQKFEV